MKRTQLAGILWALYLLAWVGTAAVLQPDGADMLDAFDDLDNSRYLVYGLIGGITLNVIVATVFGWWKPVFADDRTALGKVTTWHRWIPIFMVVLILATTDYPGFGDLDGELLGWIIAAGVLVGISEEFMFRGNILVALREEPLPESQVWFGTSLLFALIHVPNVFLGVPLPNAISQAALAFVGGTLFYVARRTTGSILVAMLLHGMWDFTLFAAQDDVYGNIRVLIYLVVGIGVIVTRKTLFEQIESPTADDSPSS